MCAVALGLSFAYVAYGALHGCITLTDDAQSLLPRLVQNGTTATVQILLLGFVAIDNLLKMFMTATNIFAFIGPVALVACYVQQVLVQVDIIAAHDGAGIINHIGGQPGLASNLYGKRAARMTYIEAE